MKRRIIIPVFGLLGLFVAASLAAPLPATAQDPAEADRAWLAGEMERAERLYEEILAADSTHYAALHRLALARAWADRHDESLALFDRMLRLYPEATDARIDRARVLAWRGDVDAALEALDTILEADPANAAAIGALGQFQSWAGRYDDALRAYARLEQLEPGARSVPYDRARVLAWAERFEAAAAVYDSILAKRPRDVDALTGLATTLLWAGMNDSAVVVFERVTEVDPVNAEALRGMARAASWEGDLKQAEGLWKAALAADTGDIQARVGLAQTLRWQGRAGAGLREVRRALASDPGSTEAREELRAARVAFAPFASPAFAHELDSDGNRMTTISATGRLRPVAPFALRVDAYRRAAREERPGDGPASGDLEQSAYGATLTGQFHLGVGWGIGLTVGASAADAGYDPVPTLALAASSPSRERVRGSLAIRRRAFDATARLIQSGVITTELAADAGLRVGDRTELRGAAGLAWFDSRASGAQNHRWSGYASASHRVLAPLTVVATLRAFGFEQDLDDGYFDPDFFGIAEVLGRYRRPVGPLELAVEAAPGFQRVGADGDARPVARASANLRWAIDPGRELSIGGVFANAGLDRLSAAQDSDYRYRAIAARLAWSF